MTSTDLGGLRIVVTRSVIQSQALVAAINKAGGSVVAVPLIEIRSPSDGGAALRRVVETLEESDWLVVLSPNGAAHVIESGVGPGGCRLAVVAVSTRRVFDEHGWPPDLVPSVPTSEGLLAALSELDAGRVVIAQAADGLPVLPDGLRGRGWDVEVVAAYENAMPELDAHAISVARSRSDVVVFASPSAVDRYVAHVGTTPAVAVCVGPVTGSVARDAGFEVWVARTPTVDSMVAELARLVGQA